MEKEVTIGIDLGTTNTCVAAYIDGKVVIIPNSNGCNITPSFVAFDKCFIIGMDAKNSAKLNPENVVYAVKRLIGQQYSEILPLLDHLSYKVIEENSTLYVQVNYKEMVKKYEPEKISAIILQYVKKMAEEYLKVKVTGAVITIPAHFGGSHRRATKKAAEIACLDVKQLISEPVAAAITYTYFERTETRRNVLVYDLGGGTFDAAVIGIRGESYEVMAVDGDSRLGGEDFDDRMVQHLIQEFTQKTGLNPSQDKKAIKRLRTLCEDAKKALSDNSEAEIEINLFFKKEDLKTIITREQFEDINQDYFDATFKIVKATLATAGLDKSNIDFVLLVGGSSRIPIVQNSLEQEFGKEKIKNNIHPEEAVAYGAALKAAALDGKLKSKLITRDVLPASLGVDVEGGKMSVILRKNSAIPNKATRIYYNTVSNQSELNIGIFEGEGQLVKDNKLLAEVDLRDIPRGPRFTVKFEYTFSIDSDGMLSVSVVEKSTKKSQNIVIYYGKSKQDPAKVRLTLDEDEK